MAESKNDVVMCLKEVSGTAIDAESTSELEKGDALMTDFTAGKFFEIDSFTFAMKLEDDDNSGSGGSGSGTGGSYEAWRAVPKAGSGANSGNTQLFYALPEELTVVRDMDKATAALLKYCMSGDKLASAVLVKRGRNSGGKLVGFFKLTLSNVYVRAVTWADGDTITETCKFRFDTVALEYVIRKKDGSTKSSVKCKWETRK